jgi:hypothetical protein
LALDLSLLPLTFLTFLTFSAVSPALAADFEDCGTVPHKPFPKAERHWLNPAGELSATNHECQKKHKETNR